MRRRLSQGIAVAAVAVTIGGGVAGCGVMNKLDAKQKVSKAFESFQTADSATFTLKLDSTSKDMKAINDADGEDGLSASDLKVVDQLLGGDIQYAVHAADGKKLGDSADSATQLSDLNRALADPDKLATTLKSSGDFALAVHLDGDALAELRFRNGVLYGRAAVPKIAGLAGQDTARVDSALADLPPSLAPLQKAAKGEWVSLDLPKLASDLKSSGLLGDYQRGMAQAQAANPTPSINAGKIQKLINDLKAAYNSKVTIKELGDSSRGTEYQLIAPAKQIAQSVQQDLIDLVGTDQAGGLKRSIADMPSKNITLNVWVKDDKLSGVALDLVQFDTKPVNAKAALDVAIAVGSGDIQAPAGATPIDGKAIINEFQSAIGTASGGYVDSSTSGTA